MVRAACFDSNGMKKGAWSEDEDNKLKAFVLNNGHSNWRLLPKYAGLKRCGKSCRLRWVNYLKPGVKRGNFTKQEEDLIIKLHAQFGNKWSIIATYLGGRTDNDIKNFWHAHVEKRSPESKKIRRQTSKASHEKIKRQTSEASRVPKEESLSSAVLINLQESSDATFTQAHVDVWPHHQMFLGDAGYDADQKEYMPPFLNEEILCDDGHHHYKELSSSESCYTSGFKWVGDNDGMSYEYHVAQLMQGSLLSESFAALDTLNSQIGSYDVLPPLQQEGGFYDPFFDHCFSYGMHFLS